MSAGAGQAPLRAAARLPRYRWQVRPDRRILRPPRRLALVRPQRRARAALSLSRLEIRRDRAMHRGAFGGKRERFLPEDQVEKLSAGKARPRAVDLYGPAGA